MQLKTPSFVAQNNWKEKKTEGNAIKNVKH